MDLDKNMIGTLGLHQLSVLSLIDQGKSETLEDINIQLENKKVFDYLEKKYGDNTQAFDFVNRDQVHDLLFDIYCALEGREQRKMWVSNNGLCVLAGYINTIMMN
ncbi:hypothetical protein [Halobacillus seohaensis]|uniref:Uncharacterized protein n=1 Tax=Halobacillus seohaensis TaxID=447421 RepID=A0ABW2EFC5_9BACI